jgi:DNA-binding LacI/PurR family transcriptional regulator
MTVRLVDISRETGLSIPSISQIINGRGHYNPDTVARVQAAAERLGYRPNAAARAMVERRFRAFGLLLSEHPHFGQLRGDCLDGIDAAMSERSLNLLFGRLRDEQILADAEHSAPLLGKWSVDGVMVSYIWSMPPALVTMLERHRLPAVFLNIKLSHDCIHPDDFPGAVEATRRLIGLGHRDIVFFASNGRADQTDMHFSGLDRRTGYCQAMTEAGLTPRVCSAALGPGEYGPFIRSWLLGPDRPSAVFCYSSPECQALLGAMLEFGLVPGRDLAVITVNDYPTRLGDIAVDTMAVPGYAMGVAAVEMLEARIASLGDHLPNRALPLIWHPGATAVPVGQIRRST